MSNSVVITSIQSLLDTIDKLKSIYGKSAYGEWGAIDSSYDFCYRGIKNLSYKLMPRAVNSDLCYTPYDLYDKPLEEFQREANGYLRNICSNDTLLWMQYAQHYGVPTRLLDFSANPLVALYFACQDNSYDGVLWIINVKRYIWVSHQTYMRKFNVNSLFAKEYLEKISSYSWEDNVYPAYFVPDYIDTRMNTQSSRFLLWPKRSFSLEELIKPENILLLEKPNANKPTFDRYILKAIVPSNFKTSLLRELDNLGINEKNLFPGLDSIGKYINSVFTPGYRLYD